MGGVSEHLSFRASPELVAALTERAERLGVSVSDYLRKAVSAPPAAIDDRDADLAARFSKGEPAAISELMALNVTSLVHRHALGDDFTGSLIEALVSHGDEAKRTELIVALLSAVDAFQLTYPSVDDMASLAERYHNRLARAGRGCVA